MKKHTVFELRTAQWTERKKLIWQTKEKKDQEKTTRKWQQQKKIVWLQIVRGNEIPELRSSSSTIMAVM